MGVPAVRGLPSHHRREPEKQQGHKNPSSDHVVARETRRYPVVVMHDHVLRRKCRHETAAIMRDTSANPPRAVGFRPAVETGPTRMNVTTKSVRACALSHMVYAAVRLAYPTHTGPQIIEHLNMGAKPTEFAIRRTAACSQQRSAPGQAGKG